MPHTPASPRSHSAGCTRRWQPHGNSSGQVWSRGVASGRHVGVAFAVGGLMSPRLLALLALTAGCTVEVDVTDGSDSEADAQDPAEAEQVAQLLEGQSDAPLTADAMVADMDQDGIADTLEELLLRRYRPYFKYSKHGT